MKLTFFLLSLCVASSLSATVFDLIRHEVHTLVNQDKDLTVDHCTTKCDALFDLAESHDESSTDKLCQYACQCQIDHAHHDCRGYVHHVPTTTHKPHFSHGTHFPHHTRAPAN